MGNGKPNGGGWKGFKDEGGTMGNGKPNGDEKGFVGDRKLVNLKNNVLAVDIGYIMSQFTRDNVEIEMSIDKESITDAIKEQGSLEIEVLLQSKGENLTARVRLNIEILSTNIDTITGGNIDSH